MPTLTGTTKGFDSFEKKITDIARMSDDGVFNKKSVFVGVVGARDSDLVVIAASNEFGTARIPSRPFMRNAMNDPRLSRFVGERMRALLRGKMLQDRPPDFIGGTGRSGADEQLLMLERIGAFMKGLVQRSIGSNTPPPNAPATIQRKKSSRTLINTGRLRQSIAWEIR